MKKTFIYLLLTLLLISALPSLWGEKPALIIKGSDQLTTLNVESVNQLLIQHNNPAIKITQTEQSMQIVFDSAAQQRDARQLIESQYPTLKSTFTYVSRAPSVLANIGLTPINLGLDLRGGVQFILKVEVQEASKKYVEASAQSIRDTLRAERVHHRLIKQDEQQLQFNLSQVDRLNKAQLGKLLNLLKSEYPEWQVRLQGSHLQMHLDEAVIDEQASLAMKQTLNIMRQRIESLGINEAITQRQGQDRILIELPGVQDPQIAKRVIGATATISFHSLSEPGATAIKHTTREGEPVWLSRTAILSGDYITGASASTGEFGQPEVNLVLSSAGGSKMSSFTRDAIGQGMATLHSEYQKNSVGELQQTHEVINVATIQSQLGSRFRITGIGQLSNAQELALILRSGSLTVPVTVIDEQVIGPTLGAENIKNGLLALSLGLTLTFISMLVLYRRFGVIACAALLVNIVMIIGLLAIIPGATLTLPGIAGLVLTMGMAVDTNVLIFERIKEELKKGTRLGKAIPIGFKEARTTIIDANLTSLITAIILFAIGYGAVKGFAITLGIGLLTSMFTGLILSQMWMQRLWGKK